MADGMSNALERFANWPCEFGFRVTIAPYVKRSTIAECGASAGGDAG